MLLRLPPCKLLAAGVENKICNFHSISRWQTAKLQRHLIADASLNKKLTAGVFLRAISYFEKELRTFM